MITMLIAIMVLAASFAIVWVMREYSHLRAKDFFVKYFADTAHLILRSSECHQLFKEFLIVVAPAIQDREVADFVAKSAGGGLPRSEWASGVMDLLGDIEKQPTQGQVQFVAAMFYFLMALSYSSRRHGGILRRRLRGELGKKDELFNEGAIAYRAVQAGRSGGFPSVMSLAG